MVKTRGQYCNIELKAEGVKIKKKSQCKTIVDVNAESKSAILPCKTMDERIDSFPKSKIKCYEMFDTSSQHKRVFLQVERTFQSLTYAKRRY